MKVSRIIVYALLALFAVCMASCVKTGVPEIGTDATSISIAIKQPLLENASKTTLGTPSDGIYPIYWLLGDEIAVNNTEGTSYATYWNSNTAGISTVGVFEKKSGANIVGFIPVYAYYPAENVISVNGSKYTVKIPQTQQEDMLGSFDMPMYGQANKLSELKSMAPLMSALKITLQGNCNVKSILLESPSTNLSGTAEVDMTTGAMTFTSGLKQVQYNCALPVSISTARSFIIVVPATAAAVSDFTVTITSSNGLKMKKKLSTSTNFKAKVIKNISSTLAVATSGEYVDLGLSVKWATFNVGATKPEEAGDFFAWGETEPYYLSFSPLKWKPGKSDGYSLNSYFDYNSVEHFYYKYHVSSPRKAVLDLEDDAAHVNWGDGSRMPTKNEINELGLFCKWELCNVKGTEGYKVSSLKSGYEGNSIFLPTSGLFDGINYIPSEVLYWSNELKEDNVAYSKFITSPSQSLRTYGGSVRPVKP